MRQGAELVARLFWAGRWSRTSFSTDRDTTVHPDNGAQAVKHVIGECDVFTWDTRLSDASWAGAHGQAERLSSPAAVPTLRYGDAIG